MYGSTNCAITTLMASDNLKDATFSAKQEVWQWVTFWSAMY